MARPTITPEIAFNSNPLEATQSFTTISTKYPVTCSIKRGRQGILDRVEASTMTMRLWDGDKLFDPINTGSTYYPNVRPRKQIRIGASNIFGFSGTKYLFTGFIEGVQPVYERGERWVDISATDATKYIARTKIDLSRAVEKSGTRINAVFDVLGWPVGNRNIPAGESDVIAVTLSNTSPLQHIQDAVTTENGLFFFDGDGKAVFHNRYYRIKQYNSINSTGIFDNLGIANIPYESNRDANDDTLLANLVIVTLGGSQVGYRRDYTSEAAYMPTALTRELPLLTSTGEGQDATGWILNQRRDLTYRMESITLNSDLSNSAQNHIFLREISDRVTIRNYFNNNPGPTPTPIIWELDHYIEGIQYNFSRDAYRCTWTLSPADNNSYMIVGDSLRGRASYNKAGY